MGARQSHLYRNIWTYVFLLALGFFVIFPLAVVFSQSLMTTQEVNRWPPPLIPVAASLDAYYHMLTRPDLRLPLWLGNSIFAASAYTVAVLVICTPAAYAFSRLKFPGRNLLFGLLLLTVMIPSQVTLIPNYLLMRDLKFLDSFNALIWPGAANVFGVFLLRQFFQQIPQELEEAAILDGATYWGRFRYVVLPLSTNAITALAILVFLGHYNDLLWPFITMNTLEHYTLPVGLQILNSSYAGQDRPVVLAAAVFATVPIVIFYIIFQRQIIKGVAMTGMGGR
jgi:multiple sugar transport system permease protein